MGFHVDHSIPKYDPEGSPQPKKRSPAHAKSSGPDETEETEATIKKAKVLVSIPALSVAATSAAVGWQTRAACAAAMGALAIWLAANWDAKPSIEG